MPRKPEPTIRALAIVRGLKTAIGAERRLGRTHLRHLVPIDCPDGRSTQTYKVDLAWDGIGSRPCTKPDARISPTWSSSATLKEMSLGGLNWRSDVLSMSAAAPPRPDPHPRSPMPLKPTKHYRSWTTGEVSALERMLSEGVPIQNIAKHLGRTKEAVNAKAHALKSVRTAPPDP